MVGIYSFAADAVPLALPPEPPAAMSHGGGAVEEVTENNNTLSPLLDLVERFPDLFALKVLAHLNPIDRTFLAQAERGCRAAVVAFVLPCAGTKEEVLEGRSVWVVTHRLTEFVGSIERLAWAKASGCPWVVRTSALRRSERASGGTEVGAGA
jgi:hypothetical protein